MNWKFSAEEQMELWEKYIELIEKYLSVRKDYNKIKEMLNVLSEKITMTPCSTKYHGNYPGGLIEHSIDCIYSALYIYEYFKLNNKQDLPTIDSIVFVSAFHDLGKIGDEDNDYYDLETSEWHIKNLGRTYRYNNSVTMRNHAHGSLYTLNKFNIDISKEEFQAILLHDGEYIENNYARIYSFNDVALLTHIIQIADQASCVLRTIKK